MINISNNGIVSMNNGDTFSYPLFINCGTFCSPERYRLRGNDTVYFVISEPHQPFEQSIIRKKYTSSNKNSYGDVVVTLTENDTENLIPGVYYMEAKIRLGNGRIWTIMPKRKFFIYE